jgi:hypothetical protein
LVLTYSPDFDTYFQIPRFFWAPDHYVRIDGVIRAGRTQEKLVSYPLGDDPQMYNNNNSAGMCYEIDHVFEQVKAGKLRFGGCGMDAQRLLTHYNSKFRTRRKRHNSFG